MCDSLTAIFTDTSYIPSPETYFTTKWVFDDDAAVTGTTASKLFDTTGKYFFSIEIITENRCRDTLVDSLFVGPYPEASFSVDDACFSDTSLFNNTTTITAGTVDSFLWELGDGTQSSATNPYHYYGSAGTYTVSLTAVSDGGCSSSFVDSLFKRPFFDVSFSYNDTCFGNGNVFTNTTVIDAGGFSDTTWYTSEPDTAKTYNLSKAFNSPGTYDVTLIMVQDTVCSDTFTTSVDIHPLVVPNFSATQFCMYDSTSFTDLSSLSSGTYTVDWDFDNGLTSDLSNPKTAYTTPGNKNIHLETTTSEGCVTDTTISIFITNPVVDSLRMEDQCLNETQVIEPYLSHGLDTFLTFYYGLDGTSQIDSVFTFYTNRYWQGSC